MQVKVDLRFYLSRTVSFHCEIFLKLKYWPMWLYFHSKKFWVNGEVFLNFSTFCLYSDFLSIVSLVNISSEYLDTWRELQPRADIFKVINQQAKGGGVSLKKSAKFSLFLILMVRLIIRTISLCSRSFTQQGIITVSQEGLTTLFRLFVFLCSTLTLIVG